VTNPLPPFLSGLSDFWKSVTALGAAVGLGATLALTLSGYAVVPAQVDAQEARITAIEVEVQGLAVEQLKSSKKLDRVLCILTLPPEATVRESVRTCQ